MAAAARMPQRPADLLPGLAKRLADEERRVRAGARLELLRAALIDFGHIEVALLIDAEVVHAPEPSGEVAPRAPRVQEVAVEVVLDHLACTAIERPQIAVEEVHQVDIGRTFAELPLVEELPVLVEHLHAVVPAIVDEDAQRGRI